MLVCGIDPGLSGGLCLYDGETMLLEHMPIKDGGIDLFGLNHLLRSHADNITRVYIELATMRPRQSTQSTFKTGRGFGNLEGMLACLGIPTVVVHSATWSKEYNHNVTEPDRTKRYALIKKARAKIASKLFPGINFLATERSTVLHAGLVDSALISHYGFTQIKRLKGLS